MEARELRLENLVYKDIHICEVKGVHQNYVYIRYPNGGIYHAHETNINPIPLTEEWLLKFGFVYQGGEGYLLEDGGIRIYASLRNDWMIYNSRHIENSKGVRYVHELQNLCFALFRKELTIKQS